MQVITFKESKKSFLELLKEHHISYVERQPTPDVITASGEIVDILNAIGAATIFPSIATVIVKWLKARSTRECIIQLKNNKIVHLKGYSEQEIIKLLEKADTLTAIDTKQNKKR